MEKEVYRECMRNHAATLGTYATDGCGEYTPDATSPAGLRCAACGCHRNFHRKDQVADLGYSPSHSADADRTSDGRRRPRTKFTPEQKEEMLRFAEKIGWRIPRREAGAAAGGCDEVGRFCMEIGVSRQIFKVWMHNHKNNSSSTATTSNNSDGSGGAAN